LTEYEAFFTVEEANALLPSVRQLLRKLQRCRHRLGTYSEEARQARIQADQGGGESRRVTLRALAHKHCRRRWAKIEAMGVQLKDFDRGLVDFPSLREGRVVLLCWQLDEVTNSSGGMIWMPGSPVVRRSKSFPQPLTAYD